MKRRRKVFEEIRLLEASVVGIPAYPSATLSYEHKSDDVEVEKKKISYQSRKELPDSAFAIPEKRKYPIHDLAHARNALARVAAFGTSEEKARVVGAVCKKYPELPTCKKRKDCTELDVKGLEKMFLEVEKMDEEKTEEAPVEETTTAEEAAPVEEEKTEEAPAEEEKTEEASEEKKSFTPEEVKKIISEEVNKAIKELKVEKKGLDSTDHDLKSEVEELRFEKGKDREFFEKVGKHMIETGFFKR